MTAAKEAKVSPQHERVIDKERSRSLRTTTSIVDMNVAMQKNVAMQNRVPPGSLRYDCKKRNDCKERNDCTRVDLALPRTARLRSFEIDVLHRQPAVRALRILEFPRS